MPPPGRAPNLPIISSFVTSVTWQWWKHENKSPRRRNHAQKHRITKMVNHHQTATDINIRNLLPHKELNHSILEKCFKKITALDHDYDNRYVFTPPASAARTSLSSLIQPSPHDEWSCWWKPTGSVIKASIIWLGTIKQLAEQLWWLTGTLERWRGKAHKDWWQQRDSDWTQKDEVISNQSQFLCSWLAHLSSLEEGVPRF